MELSVVLSVRNGARTIGRQLEALAGQRWDAAWELVVSDNGSTDETRAIVERYRDRLPSLRVIDASARVGLPHSRNAGVAAAAGEAIAFCDDDDEVADGWVAAMGEVLRHDELVAGRLDLERDNEPWAIQVRGNPQEDSLPEWGFVPYLPFAFGCTIGVSRRLHESVGGFDELLVPAGEDMDYCWRLQQAGATIRFVPAAVTYYALRHDLQGIYRQARNYGLGNVLVYEKHRRLGMPAAPRPLATGLRKWLALPKHLALGWSKRRRAHAAWQLGLRTGMLRGAVQRRVLFL
jgi:glycosyltransferase involved in cell wall biosynthesis